MEILGTKTFIIESSLKAQAVKVLEEAAELVEAVKGHGSVEEEGSDVIQAVLNLFDMMGLGEKDVERAMRDCYERNRRRGRVE